MTKTLLLSLVLLTSQSFACSNDGQNGFLPANTMSIPVFMKGLFGGLSQELFTAVIDRVEDEYQPVFANRGLTLKVARLWDNARVNAEASFGVSRKDRTVAMYGGLARHPQMTADAFTLVLCHEVGHHLAGAPLYAGELLSAEAQSDYFATAKCARKAFLHDDNKKLVKISEVPAVARVQCAKAHPDKVDQLICLRTAVASLALGKVLATIPSVSAAPKLETPDRLVVAKTNESYPSDQCRLDTFFQGSLCEKSFNEDFSSTDEVVGACHGKTGQTTGVRPLCWFKPKS